METILTDEELHAADLPREEMRREIAVMLFEQERLQNPFSRIGVNE